MAGTLRRLAVTGNIEWRTPSWLVELARVSMGSIDVDPATTAAANLSVRARTIFTMETNGLAHSWHGNIWLNPPYARGLVSLFITKLAQEVQAGHTKQFVAITNNDTETHWAQKLFELSDGVCFLHKRVHFCDEEGRLVKGNMQGQMVCYAGQNRARFTALAAPYGALFLKVQKLETS